MTWGRLYWPAALSAIMLIIGGPEIYALVTNARNTLSDWVWVQLRITVNESPANWTAAAYLFFCLWVTLFSWLTWHFFFRRFT